MDLKEIFSGDEQGST